MTAYDVVIPSARADAITGAVHAVLRQAHPPGRLIVVDDAHGPLPALPNDVTVLRTSRAGAGPATARNVGWRAATAPWVVFLDDDVRPGDGWSEMLRADLGAADRWTAAVQGRVHVDVPPRPAGDRASEIAALADAAWITADLAVRRRALVGVGGFDERFPRAYREDADLAIRLCDAGWTLSVGRRRARHPVPASEPWLAAVRRQAGNADDALMRALHGPRWRAHAHAPRGRLPRHATITAAAAFACAAPAPLVVRRAAAVIAAAGIAELTTHRLRGARPSEAPRTIATSVLIPFAAVGWRAWGEVRARRLTARRPIRRPVRPLAVLVDRDDTIVVDVPHNADPAEVRPMPGARKALDRLRAAGLPVGVVTNQSGVARGLVTPDELALVNAEVERQLGPFAAWAVCTHAEGDACPCRKPRPGLVLRAAAALGVPPETCVVIGDIASDVDAADAAGAMAVLVPSARTRPEEVAAAPVVADTLDAAVDLVLGALAA